MEQAQRASTPKYNKPPVVETVLGVQFAELAKFQAPHFGLYWHRIKQQYPFCEDRARLPEVVEAFPRKPTPPKPSFRFSDAPIPDRVWFKGRSGSELIQVQPDRFLFNWRRHGPEASYQDYDDSSAKFLQEFEGFCRFCRSENLEEPMPTLCEVTYVNHIMPHEDESAIDLFAAVFTGLSWEHTDKRLLAPENVTLNRVYVIEEGNAKLGRLYAEASLAVRQEDQEQREFVLLKMTGRVRHDPKGSTDLTASLDVAHEWAANGFASVTDLGIQHERWERTR